jgi:energy-coupling factor transporter ATP-binding protein EcfA2
MFIKKFQIQNFKSFQDITINFNQDVNILTGRNNSGKTTVLEALSLWYECFQKLLTQAKRSQKNYRKDDWVLGPTSNRYFAFDQINSVRSPNFEDIFHDCQRKNKIKLNLTFQVTDESNLDIRFNIGESGNKYIIELDKFTTFNFDKFNSLLQGLPAPFSIYYASPVATIAATEDYLTSPQIENLCMIQKSGLALRNRLFQIYRLPRLFDLFRQDLSYILFNHQQTIVFQILFDEAKDIRVVVKYKIESSERFKDIALLGSGTLQLVEILLNFYQADSQGNDFRLIMLDEPDSYIHRDIQKRLVEIVTRFAQKTQVIISTHNESFIRSAPIEQIFHLDGKSTGEYQPIDRQEIERLQPRFKGIYPSLINPVIRSIGEITGLDFINAIECDRLIFVEGEDDARVMNVLLKQQLGTGKRYMFWVLGGINEVFENILAYKTVFSAIKNGQSLWQKSCLIIDKDFLTHQHQMAIASKFKEKHQLDVFAASAYTFESTIFENLDFLSVILSQWIEVKKNHPIDRDDVLRSLQVEYAKIGQVLAGKYSDNFIEQETQRYRNIREKTNILFDNSSIIKENDIQLTTLVRNNLKKTLDSHNYYWLMRKDEVTLVINSVAQKYGLNFECETDFIEIIKAVTKSTWMNQWDFLNQL